MVEHKTRVHGDQYHCHVCCKQWDTNDPNPPECVEKKKLKLDVLCMIDTLQSTFNTRTHIDVSCTLISYNIILMVSGTSFNFARSFTVSCNTNDKIAAREFDLALRFLKEDVITGGESKLISNG